MDFLSIVINGYFEENNREFLKEYFLREFKKAEKEHYFKSNTFFNGCMKVLESWEKDLENQVSKRKMKLIQIITSAEQGSLKHNDLKEKTIEEANKEAIEYCTKELNNIRTDGVGSTSNTVNLFHLTNGKVQNHVSYFEILLIKGAIIRAQIELISHDRKLGLEEIGNKIKELENKLKELEISNIKGVEKKKVKTFIEYLSHTQKEQFAESLKNEFKTEIGKDIAILITLLKSRSILNLSSGMYHKFYISMATYFNRDIGSETILNRYKGNGYLMENKNKEYENDYKTIDNRVAALLNDLEKEENRL